VAAGGSAVVGGGLYSCGEGRERGVWGDEDLVRVSQE
jgi:hypothetical protein